MPNIELTRTDNETRDVPVTYRFDRRRHPRYDATGRVTAIRRTHELNAYRHPLCSLQMQNLSDGGLSAISDMPLSPDEVVTVCFPPHGAERGFDLYGHVLRCQPNVTDDSGHGYAIAIVFDQRPAA